MGFKIYTKTGDKGETGLSVPAFPENAIQRLEELMDDMDAQLEPLKNFILPGGNIAVSSAHICRTICRRAERRVIALSELEEVDSWIIQYLNRLSDFFFMYARFIGKQLHVQERPWIPGE